MYNVALSGTFLDVLPKHNNFYLVFEVVRISQANLNFIVPEEHIGFEVKQSFINNVIVSAW